MFCVHIVVTKDLWILSVFIQRKISCVPLQEIERVTSGNHLDPINWKSRFHSLVSWNRGEEEEEAPVYRSSTPESQTVSKPLIKLISHQGFVTVGEWTVDGTQVLTGSQDATIKVWDMSDPSKPLFTFPGHDSTITSIACHPSNTNLFCSCMVCVGVISSITRQNNPYVGYTDLVFYGIKYGVV